jgi:hypothetical protein
MAHTIHISIDHLLPPKDKEIQRAVAGCPRRCIVLELRGRRSSVMEGMKALALLQDPIYRACVAVFAGTKSLPQAEQIVRGTSNSLDQVATALYIGKSHGSISSASELKVKLRTVLWESIPPSVDRKFDCR